MKHTRLIVIGAVLWIVGAVGIISAADTSPTPATTSAAAKKEWIAKTYPYKTVGEVKIEADVYRAEDARPRPVLLWIHGGGLVVGSRQWMRPDLVELCRTAGYCLVSMDYRLVPEVKIPQIVEDLQDCLRWIHEKGPDLFHADPRRIVVAGASSGGYLALMAGLCQPAPQALVSFWGGSSVGEPAWDVMDQNGPRIPKEQVEWAVTQGVQTSVPTGGKLFEARMKYVDYLRQNGLLAKEFLGTDSSDRRHIDPYCPVLNVTPQYPPTLLVHGELDGPQQARDMAEQLQNKHVVHELVMVPGAGHGLSGGDKHLVAQAFGRARAFIQEHLGPAPATQPASEPSAAASHTTQALTGESRSNDARGGGSIKTHGILTAQDQDSLTILTEGEDTPATYTLADSFDRKQLMITWPISPLQMTYVKEGNVRRLLNIKSETHADKGTVIGTVAYIGPNAFWIAVKPKNGPTDAYACSWPPGDVESKLKSLHKGDAVASLRFHADGQRYRIDSLNRGSEVLEAPAVVLPAGVEAVFDVEYAKVADQSLRLDVFRPKDAKGPWPLVVWIHGGAWMAGSKDDPPAWVLSLVPAGYVVAGINYRLSFEAVFPAQIHDCKAAIRFLRANARTYSIAPDHVGVWGSSAGGHLAALVGASGGVQALEGGIGGNLGFSSRVQCVAEYFGPTDLLAYRGQKTWVKLDPPNSFLVRYVGGPVDEKNPLAIQANPIPYVSKETPPFFIAHGDQDDTVPFNQSELLVEAIRKAGGVAAFEVVKGANHDFAPDSQRQYERLAPLVRAFFDKYLKSRP